MDICNQVGEGEGRGSDRGGVGKVRQVPHGWTHVFTKKNIFG